ncbi:hypothetical protein ARNL5_01853 [Anaerolineae bacterium]|nr:hypothetical protein ARNL5_01853 [Anaerolineae bacterium]
MNAIIKPHISIEEYLASELIAETKHQYINGEVYAMAGTSKMRDKIVVVQSFQRSSVTIIKLSRSW